VKTSDHNMTLFFAVSVYRSGDVGNERKRRRKGKGATPAELLDHLCRDPREKKKEKGKKKKERSLTANLCPPRRGAGTGESSRRYGKKDKERKIHTENNNRAVTRYFPPYSTSYSEP